jgi:hypothetical protein
MKYNHSHPTGNTLKTIDFIGDSESDGPKIPLRSSHSVEKHEKHHNCEAFYEIPVGSL